MTCEELEARVAHLERENALLATDLDLLQVKYRKALRSEQFALNKLNAAQAIDPSNAEIKDLLEYWHKAVGRDGRTKLPLDGDRAKRVRWALKHFDASEIREAIDGLALFPYVWGDPKRRMRHGVRSQRSDDLTACLYSERTVERFRALAGKAPSSGVWVLVEEDLLNRMEEKARKAFWAARMWRSVSTESEELLGILAARIGELQRERDRDLRVVA